ncbi:phosphotransferase family protein [Metarhizium album ARSEF 1941]|uniref:Phosphotransferase family protein n=1 Tax=Metarhizium album (strain ARSEF 1941) TaxID=1081103 RepID=A0A0B2X4G3_METAS|nr:phosphotransferase family protein [Metarhizium album ARSEF 1941]KHO00191.1 phosphotransferase family protein [Metarhizium album ARSEF 1941]
MAPNNNDGDFVNDEPVTSNVKDVKPLPPDVSEEDIDETVRRNPEMQEDMVDGIDESNIIEETTRGAQPEGGSYKEPSDDVSDLVK